jgi:hypothetical protein
MRLRCARQAVARDAPVDARELRVQIYACAGSRARVTSASGLRDAATLRALAQASNLRATTPWRSLQTWAMWWPFRLPPENEIMGLLGSLVA